MSESDLTEQLRESRLRFVASVGSVRPKLHRYCARMTGSGLDGEDVVQEVLAQAFYKLSLFHDDRPLEPWLFKIAHNRCIDFLRRKRVPTVELDESLDAGEAPADDPEQRQEVGRALVAMVTRLPPKERACLLLKDVLDYSLADIAEIVDSSVGGVKAALHRARTSLRELGDAPERAAARDVDPVVAEYVERFNRRDWDAVRDLVRADARLEVVGEAEIRLADAEYFSNYERQEVPWRMSAGSVDGEPAIICSREVDGQWRPRTAIRFVARDGKIAEIRDYVHVEYVLEDSDVETN